MFSVSCSRKLRQLLAHIFRPGEDAPVSGAEAGTLSTTITAPCSHLQGPSVLAGMFISPQAGGSLRWRSTLGRVTSPVSTGVKAPGWGLRLTGCGDDPGLCTPRGLYISGQSIRGVVHIVLSFSFSRCGRVPHRLILHTTKLSQLC